MKKVLVVLVLLATVVTLASCQKKGDALAANMYKFIIDESYTETVTMLTSADYAPYESLEIIDGKEIPVGADIELGKAIAKTLGKNLIIINQNFDNVILDLKDGKGDFAISGIDPNEQRREVVDFSDIYWDSVDNPQCVLVQIDKVDNLNTMEKLNVSNIKLGAQSGSIQQDIIEEFAPIAVHNLGTTMDELANYLNTGHIDALFTETMVAKKIMKVDQFQGKFAISLDVPGLEYSGSAVAVQKGNPELLDAINNTIKELKAANQFATWFDNFI